MKLGCWSVLQSSFLLNPTFKAPVPLKILFTVSVQQGAELWKWPLSVGPKRWQIVIQWSDFSATLSFPPQAFPRDSLEPFTRAVYTLRDLCHSYQLSLRTANWDSFRSRFSEIIYKREPLWLWLFLLKGIFQGSYEQYVWSFILLKENKHFHVVVQDFASLQLLETIFKNQSFSVLINWTSYTVKKKKKKQPRKYLQFSPKESICPFSSAPQGNQP